MHGSRFQRRRERMNPTESSSSSDSSGNEKKYGTRAASAERRQKSSQESVVTIELSEDGLSPEAARAKKAARHNRELLRGAMERRQIGERCPAKSTGNEDLEMEKQASKKGDKSASPQTKEVVLAYFGFIIIITLCLGLICVIFYNYFKQRIFIFIFYFKHLIFSGLIIKLITKHIATTKQEIAEAERLINHIERDHLKNNKKYAFLF